jgi:hypothetical protein
MKKNPSEKAMWMVLFFGIALGYALFYAPYGVNETDGGFLTGLAWQVLQGKTLYGDVVYVRPPLPVWLRALEIYCLPERWGVLGERWIFYLKVGLFSWMGAAMLYRDKQRWILATLGFVVSAHCYPPMAWHTVDGILFSVTTVYLFFNAREGRFGIPMQLLAGISMVAAVLCKQSFYPLFPIFTVVIGVLDWRKMLVFLGGFVLALGLFVGYLYQFKLLNAFFEMTGGAASGGQAIQHGLFDYAMITPELAFPGMFAVICGWWMYRSGQHTKTLAFLLGGFLFAMVVSFAAVVWKRQEHTAPFAQTRFLFDVAAAHLLYLLYYTRGKGGLSQHRGVAAVLLLLSISWSAAISWGYSLPILFSTPWIWTMMEWSSHAVGKYRWVFPYYRAALLSALLVAFYVGHSFVYRDGRRQDMTEPMGAIFPAMTGIYSDTASAALYRDLKRLAATYGPNFKVLPAFPQANYLTGTLPPLPLDWVVNRETNGKNKMVINDLNKKKPIVFLEKTYLNKLQQDPELRISNAVYATFKKLEETPFFIVLQGN